MDRKFEKLRFDPERQIWGVDTAAEHAKPSSRHVVSSAPILELLAALMMEENRLPPELMRLIDQRQGEVFWMNGLAEPRFDLGRPQWASPLQGVPIIFSPVLAAEWRRRMQILMDLRLADQKMLRALGRPRSADVPRLSQDGVRRLCARDDAPAWVIAPLEDGKEFLAGIEMKVWSLPQPQFQLTKADSDFGWRRIDAFGVIACGGQKVARMSKQN